VTENTTMEIVEITPEMARGLLDTAERNRPVRQARVAEWARRMKSGEWQFNADPIRISDKGVLIDGQHRLLACIDTKLPFKALVVRGLPSSVFITLDNQAPRSLSDDLAMDEVSNYTVVSAALGWVWLYDKGRMNLSQRPVGTMRGTRQELLEFYHSCNAETWTRAARAGYKAKSLLGSTGLGAACHFIFQRFSAQKADEYFERLLTGELNADGSPFPLLRKRLMRDMYEDRDARLSSSFKMALIFKAWNAFISNTEIKRLQITPKEREAFPVALVVGGNGK